MQENPAVEIKGECWNLISNCPYKSTRQRVNEKGLESGEVIFDGKLKTVEAPFISVATTILNSLQTPFITQQHLRVEAAIIFYGGMRAGEDELHEAPGMHKRENNV